MHAARRVCAGWCLGLLFVAGSASAAEKATFAELVAADQPIVWWRCDAAKDAVTTVAVPSSLTEISGRIVGAVKTGAEGPRPPVFLAFSDDNKAIEFKGDGASIRFSDPGDNSPLDFQNGDAITLEAWVNVTKLGNGQQMYVVGKGRTKNKDFAAENQNTRCDFPEKNGRRASASSSAMRTTAPASRTTFTAGRRRTASASTPAGITSRSRMSSAIPIPFVVIPTANP